MLYSLRDLNGDGVEELIDYRYLRILTIRDGQCAVYFDTQDAPGVVGSLYFCQDGTVLIKGFFRSGGLLVFHPGEQTLEFDRRDSGSEWLAFGSGTGPPGGAACSGASKQAVHF